MNDSQRLQLNKMIKTNNVEDFTNVIREKNHSHLIDKDIKTMNKLKQEYYDLALSNPEEYNSILYKQCYFLYQNYTDIFNRLKNDELDLNIMNKFIDILRQIELGEIDQHEGAYKVGKYLKEIYIDSAMKRGDKIDKEFSSDSEKEITSTKKISWTQYKKLHSNS